MGLMMCILALCRFNWRMGGAFWGTPLHAQCPSLLKQRGARLGFPSSVHGARVAAQQHVHSEERPAELAFARGVKCCCQVEDKKCIFILGWA